MANLGVQGIPMLAVLGANGQMLETNAVQVMTACVNVFLFLPPWFCDLRLLAASNILDLFFGDGVLCVHVSLVHVWLFVGSRPMARTLFMLQACCLPPPPQRICRGKTRMQTF